MERRAPLIIGLTSVALALLLWPRHTDTVGHTPWPGPAGTRWAGTELRGMQRWGGFFSNVNIAGEYLELRCQRFPLLRTRRTFWPGPEWRGWTEWEGDGVTYHTSWRRSKPEAGPISIGAPWWLGLCPT